jgi:alpha-L-fucosidase
MRPYDRVTVRGVPIDHVRRAWNVATGRELATSGRCAIVDRLLGRDPLGELTIEVPGEELDPLATVLAVEWE